LPADVNDRNVEIVNHPTITYTAGVAVFAVGRMPLNHYLSGERTVTLVPVDPTVGSGSLYLSIFDFDNGAGAPIAFTMDTLGQGAWYNSAKLVAGVPNPEVPDFETTCNGTTNCNNVWMAPQWWIGLPVSAPGLSWLGGNVEATYTDTGGDAHTWYVAITGGRPVLTD
jgi:hypothetical protein